MFPPKQPVGKRMADALMADQLKKKGRQLEKASFVLWYGESNRHQGIAEAQALYLLGTEPVWNGRGQVEDVKLIPAAQLGRPRVDVVLDMSGLYRDGMPEKLQLLDRAVKLVAAAEEDNAILRNAALVEQRLRQQGVDAGTARKAGLARLFGPAPQSFGPGLVRMMELSQDDNNQRVLRHTKPLCAADADSAAAGDRPSRRLSFFRRRPEITAPDLHRICE
jgi:cobaltochelatase CobN